MTDYTESAERFTSDTKNHQLTVLHDDGIYRHLRFKAPDSGFYWFDLVTWPGYLAFTGDMDGYVFSRVEDMFTFFRGGSTYGINPSYWGEKVVDGRDRLRRYEPDVLAARLAEVLKEHEAAYPDLVPEFEAAKTVFDATPRDRRYPHALDGVREPFEPKPPAEVRELIADYERDGETGYEDGARRLLGELESARVVYDSFEWDLRGWDWTFLWACHAIVWGIRQYDALKAEKPVEAVAHA